MAVVKNDIAFDLNLTKIIIYALATGLVIVLWQFLAILIVLAAFGYAGFKFVKLAAGGFSCAHCYFHFFVALALFLFTLIGMLNQGSILIPVLLLWLNAFIGGKHS